LPGLIALSLLPGLSTNPYNQRDDIGAPDFTWESQEEGEPILLARIERRFRGLERASRAQLQRAFRKPESLDTGRLEVVVQWANLETGQSDETVLKTEV